MGHTMMYFELLPHLEAVFGGDCALIPVENQQRWATETLDTMASIDALVTIHHTSRPSSVYGVALRQQRDYAGVCTFTIRSRLHTGNYTELDKLTNRYFDPASLGPRFHIQAYYTDPTDPTTLLRFAVAETADLMRCYMAGTYYTRTATPEGNEFIVIDWSDVADCYTWRHDTQHGWDHLEQRYADNDPDSFL